MLVNRVIVYNLTISCIYKTQKQRKSDLLLDDKSRVISTISYINKPQ